MACSKWSFGWKFEGCILIFKIFLSVYPSWTTIGSAALHRHHWLNFCCLPKHFSPSLRSSLLPPSPPSTSFCSRPFRNGLKQRQQQQQQQKKRAEERKLEPKPISVERTWTWENKNEVAVKQTKSWTGESAANPPPALIIRLFQTHSDGWWHWIGPAEQWRADEEEQKEKEEEVENHFDGW